MEENVRKILGGMSTAGLILAGSLPLIGTSGWTQCTVTHCSAGTRAKSAKAKDKSAAKNAADNAKTKAPAAKSKSQTTKTK